MKRSRKPEARSSKEADRAGSIPVRPRISTVGLLWLLTSSGFWLPISISQTPLPSRGILEREPERFRADAKCEDCHVEIAREWAQSAHARALTSKEAILFRNQYAAFKPEFRRYYAPRLLINGAGPVEMRTDMQDASVDCIACHMDSNYAMHGPLGTVAPHKVVQNAQYEKSEFCARCHGQNDYLNQFGSWKNSSYAANSVGCQDCHMPAKQQTLVQHWSMPDMPVRRVRSHRFRGIDDMDFLKSAVSLRLSREANTLVVRITNDGAGHEFPGMGMRAAVVHVQVFDSNRVIDRKRVSFDLDESENRIRPLETRKLRFSLGAQARRAEAKIFYKKFFKQPDGSSLALAEAVISF